MNFKLRLETKKQKIIALILAIVSVILCVAIVLVTVASCSGGSEGGQTVKKVVKKKIIIVNEPEVDISDGTTDTNNTVNTDNTDNTVNNNSSDMTIYDVVDEDYDGPEEVVDTVVVPEYEVELEGNNPTPLEDKIALGFYSYNWGEWTAQFAEKYGKEADILTVGSVGSIDTARWAKENGVSGFLTPACGKGYFDGDEPSDNWKDNILSTAEAYKVAGVWDVVEGFHLDEPLLKISGVQFRNMTKFLAETFPDKRIFPVHCNYEINGTSMSGGVYDTIGYDTSAYCTDIGYDNYHSVDIDYQREMVNKIKDMVGRKDVRIWLFPTTFNYSNYDEDYMIEHLNMYYKLLMEQENPGGLYMFSWKTWGTMTGFSQLTDTTLGWNYTRLLDRVVEIGKELKIAEYKYKTTKN